MNILAFSDARWPLWTTSEVVAASFKVSPLTTGSCYTKTAHPKSRRSFRLAVSTC